MKQERRNHVETYVAPNSRTSKTLALVTLVMTVTRTVIATMMTTKRSAVLESALITMIGASRTMMIIQATNIRVNLWRSQTGNIAMFGSREILLWGCSCGKCEVNECASQPLVTDLPQKLVNPAHDSLHKRR